MHSFGVVLVPYSTPVGKLDEQINIAMKKAITRGWPGDIVDSWELSRVWSTAWRGILPVQSFTVQGADPKALVTPTKTLVKQVWIPEFKEDDLWPITYMMELRKKENKDLLAVCIDYHS